MYVICPTLTTLKDYDKMNDFQLKAGKVTESNYFHKTLSTSLSLPSIPSVIPWRRSFKEKALLQVLSLSLYMFIRAVADSKWSSELLIKVVS